MIRVLFVCLGNICRSPLAEGIFDKMISKQGLQDQISCDSCGTAAYHIGSQPDSRTVANAKENGLILNHQARQFDGSDFEKYDHILVMDRSNLDNVRIFEEYKEGVSKVELMRMHDLEEPNVDVPDPYYYGFNGKEKDQDGEFGNNNHLDFGARIYNPAIGRWLSRDPLWKKYPEYSPYVYAGDNPILFIDPDGNEIVLAHLSEARRKQYNAQISRIRAENVYFDVLYSMLESSDIKYYVTEGERRQVAGSFIPGINDKGENVVTGGNVDFRSFEFDQSTAMEEFFHAYQNELYVDKGGNRALRDLGSNVEFEAKFFKLMSDVNGGGMISVFPDVEKLNSMVYDLIEKYDLTDDQKREYFEALDTFVGYHKKQKDNIERQTGKRPRDLYDAPATEQTPDAAFKLLKAGDEKKSKND